MQNYKITFYNMKEEAIIKFIKQGRSIGTIFDRVKYDFGCDDNQPYEFQNGHIYGYINYFECYGRFKVQQI